MLGRGRGATRVLIIALERVLLFLRRVTLSFKDWMASVRRLQQAAR
jgi:hypothetical protein